MLRREKGCGNSLAVMLSYMLMQRAWLTALSMRGVCLMMPSMLRAPCSENEPPLPAAYPAAGYGLDGELRTRSGILFVLRSLLQGRDLLTYHVPVQGLSDYKLTYMRTHGRSCHSSRRTRVDAQLILYVDTSKLHPPPPTPTHRTRLTRRSCSATPTGRPRENALLLLYSQNRVCLRAAG